MDATIDKTYSINLNWRVPLDRLTLSGNIFNLSVVGEVKVSYSGDLKNAGLKWLNKKGSISRLQS